MPLAATLQLNQYKHLLAGEHFKAGFMQGASGCPPDTLFRQPSLPVSSWSRSEAFGICIKMPKVRGAFRRLLRLLRCERRLLRRRRVGWYDPRSGDVGLQRLARLLEVAAHSAASKEKFQLKFTLAQLQKDCEPFFSVVSGPTLVTDWTYKLNKAGWGVGIFALTQISLPCHRRGS